MFSRPGIAGAFLLLTMPWQQVRSGYQRRAIMRETQRNETIVGAYNDVRDLNGAIGQTINDLRNVLNGNIETRTPKELASIVRAVKKLRTQLDKEIARLEKLHERATRPRRS